MTSPQKIVLKSTTKISLNDRFSAYRKETSVTSIRQKMQMMRQASARNRRLAQQMENRPSVIAALKLKKRSLRQRLGQAGQNNVKARLSLGFRGLNRSFRGKNATTVATRGGRFIQARGVLRRRNILQRRGTRGGFVNNASPTGTVRSGTSPLIKARLGNQNTFLRSNRGNRRSRGGGSRRNAGRRGAYSNRGGNQQGQNFRIQRGQRGMRTRGQFSGRRSRGGRGRGRGGQQKNVPTRQELDNQLDEYMAKTKSFLDAEIDAYMSQAATE